MSAFIVDFFLVLIDCKIKSAFDVTILKSELKEINFMMILKLNKKHKDSFHRG